MAFVHGSFACCEKINKSFSFKNTGLPVEGKLTFFSFNFFFIYPEDKMLCVYIGQVLPLKHVSEIFKKTIALPLNILLLVSAAQGLTTVPSTVISEHTPKE